MFKGMSLAEFQVDNKKAYLFIDNGMSIAGLQAIGNAVTHYSVERQKEDENEKAQQIKDEEANKLPKLTKEKIKSLAG